MGIENEKPKIYYDEYFKTGIPYFWGKYIGTTEKPNNYYGIGPFYGYEGLKNVGSAKHPMIVKDEEFVLHIDHKTGLAKIPKTKNNLRLAFSTTEWKLPLVERGFRKDEDGLDAFVEISRKYKVMKPNPLFKRVVSPAAVEDQMAEMKRQLEILMEKKMGTEDEDIVDTELVPEAVSQVIPEEDVQVDDSDAVDFTAVKDPPLKGKRLRNQE